MLLSRQSRQNWDMTKNAALYKHHNTTHSASPTTSATGSFHYLYSLKPLHQYQTMIKIYLNQTISVFPHTKFQPAHYPDKCFISLKKKVI